MTIVERIKKLMRLNTATLPRFIRVCFSQADIEKAQAEIKKLPFNPCRLKPKIIHIKKMSVPGRVRYGDKR